MEKRSTGTSESAGGTSARRLGIAALSSLGVTLLLLVALAAAGSLSAAKPLWPQPVRKAFHTITSQDLVGHVSILASEAFEGRAAGEPGGKLAADYIARALEKLGLEPLGVDGTYFQPVSLPKKGSLGDGRNVIGIYRGSDPVLREEAVILGAHFDHLGYARHNPSLSLGTAGKLHNGADDNASGIAGLIEVVEAFTSKKVEVKRSVIFLAFDGEELGLLGSKTWVNAPTFPLEKIRAMLNVDMISRNKPTEMYFGSEPRFSGLNALVTQVAEKFRIRLNPEGMEQYLKRSDQWPFMEKEIPACFIFGGMHGQYHTEMDDVDLIDRGKIETIARLLFLFAYECANHTGEFRAPEPPQTPGK